MSLKFKLVQSYWNLKVWNKTRVRAAVVKGWITGSEYQEITGEAYE